jgi:hypothetical protein
MVWWAWMLLAWVLVFRIGRRRWRRWGRPPGWGMWMNPYQRAWLLEHNRSRFQYMQSGLHSARAAPPVPEPALTPAQARERAIADVRKRYVADEITVEQYEREVDAILAKQP